MKQKAKKVLRFSLSVIAIVIIIFASVHKIVLQQAHATVAN